MVENCWTKPSFVLDLASVDEAYETIKSILNNDKKICGHQLKSKRFIKSMDALDYQSSI